MNKYKEETRCWEVRRMNDNNKKIDSATIAVCGFLAVIASVIIYFISAVLNVSSRIFFKGLLIFLIIATIIFIIGMIGIFMKNSNDKANHVASMNQFQKEYDEYISKKGIVKSDDQVTLIEKDNKYKFEDDIPHYVWIDDNCIKLFPMAKYYKFNETSAGSKPDVTKLHLKSIPIDSVLYFEEMGELRKYTTVSGGGTSLKGALLGYVIADDLGAIIGSREPIKTSVVSEDDRRVELIYKNEDSDIENLEFAHDAYKVLKKLIPFKELKRIANLKTAKKNKDTTEAKTQEPQTAKDKLKQLKEMKKEGLITEDEFLEQKKKILDTF